MTRAQQEGRDLTDEEDQQYKKHWNEVSELTNAIQREEQQRELERQVADDHYHKAVGGGQDSSQASDDAEARRAAFNSFLSRGHPGLSEAERRALLSMPSTWNPASGRALRRGARFGWRVPLAVASL